METARTGRNSIRMNVSLLQREFGVRKKAKSGKETGGSSLYGLNPDIRIRVQYGRSTGSHSR
jgi:hypothetical protein